MVCFNRSPAECVIAASTFSLCNVHPYKNTLSNQKTKLIWEERYRYGFVDGIECTKIIIIVVIKCVYVRAVIQTCKKIYAMYMFGMLTTARSFKNRTKPKIHLLDLDLPPAGIVSRKPNAFLYRSMNNKCKLIKQYFCISARTMDRRPCVP